MPRSAARSSTSSAPGSRCSAGACATASSGGLELLRATGAVPGTTFPTPGAIGLSTPGRRSLAHLGYPSPLVNRTDRTFRLQLAPPSNVRSPVASATLRLRVTGPAKGDGATRGVPGIQGFVNYRPGNSGWQFQGDHDKPGTGTLGGAPYRTGENTVVATDLRRQGSRPWHFRIRPGSDIDKFLARGSSGSQGCGGNI